MIQPFKASIIVAVCNEVDDDVRARYTANQAMGKKGLVLSVENYELYALTWADIFKSFDLRHSFLLDKLRIDQTAIVEALSHRTGDTTSRASVDQLSAVVLCG